MKNKQYIYRWLFLPLVACIMAGTTGCGSDMTEESGKPSPDGRTYLTVTARGITDQPPTGGNYDDYIVSLRILAFDENGGKLCNTLYKGSEGNGAKQWTATDDAITIKEKLGNGGGRCSFYFIANEEAYRTMEGTKTLKDKLAEVMKEDDLKDIEISFTSAEINGGRAILMTAVEEDYPIIAGKDNSGMVVYLERVLAKARIQVVNESSQSSFSVSNVRLANSQIPSSYALLKGEKRKTTQFLQGETDMSGTLDSNTYTSKTIYMPERILDDSQNESKALKISLDVTVDNNQSKSYELPVGDGKQTPVNYNIDRNNDYTTTGHIKEWGEPIIISARVDDWEMQEENREWLGAAEVEFNSDPYGSNKTNEKQYLYVVYDEHTPTTVTFSIQVTAPVGNEWNVVCSNPALFEATIDDSDADGGVITENDSNHIITIKAKDSYPTTGEQPQTDFYVTFSNGEYVTDMVIRQGSDSNFEDGYAGGTQTRFVIVQEPAVIN